MSAAAETPAPQPETPAAPEEVPDFNLPESMAGAKGFINELEEMEKRLLEKEDGGFDE